MVNSYKLVPGNGILDMHLPMKKIDRIMVNQTSAMK